MQIKEVDVEKTEIFSIGRQYSHNVLVIHFVNLPNLKNKYIYYKIDDIEEEIPLVSDLFIVSRPLTMHSGKVKAQIIVRDEANETIDLTKNFTMIIKASNYSGIGEDENYPDDLNIKNYFVKIDEKVNSFEELANLVQTKLDNGEFIGAQGPKGEKGDPGDVTEEYRNLAMQIAQNASDAQTSATNAQTSASNAQRILDDTKEFANQTKTELNQIKNDTSALKEEANASAVNAKASETKAEEYANNLQNSAETISQLKEDLDNLREIEFYPNLLNKAEFIVGKQMVTSAGSTPDELVDNENTTTTNIINCDGDEYFETNLPNGQTVILAYFWHQEKWYRSQFISTLETEGDHYKFKINAQMKKIRIYCTSNMIPANPILTKQGEYDESKPEFLPKGKIKLTPSGCVGYDNLDDDTKQRIDNKTSNYSEYIPFYGKKIVGIGDSIMVGINSDGSAIIDGIGENGLPCTDQGYQINSTGGFLGELRKKYPSINVVNMGVGSTTMQRNDNVNVNKVYKCISDRIDSIPDDADIIILEGGINDFFHASKGCVLGTYKDNLYKYPTSAKYENGAYSYVEFAVDTTLDVSTFCGALEIALTKILVRFVGKPFIYVIPHNPSASADIDTFFDSAKSICEKYGVPVVDIRKVGCMPRIYTLSGKIDGTSAFTQDGVHPNPLGYQLHYVPVIASALKSIM